jgi:hypothetical protein
MIQNKRGLSDIVTTLLLVVLGLVAIIGVWVVVANVLKSGEQQTTSSFGTFFIALKMQKVSIDMTGNLVVLVEREVGEGDLKSINFIISDGTNSKVITKDTTLSELGTQTFTLSPTELDSLGLINEVSIAPIFGDGKVGQKVDTSKNIIQNALSFTTTFVSSPIPESGNYYTYWMIYSGSYLIQSGDYLQYDVYCNSSNFECLGGMEIEGGDFTGRSYDLVDQNGLQNFTGDYSSKKGQWYHREMPLNSISGKTITEVSVVEESNHVNTYNYYYRNIVITNAGPIKKTFYSGGQPQANELNYGAGNINSAVVPL